MHNTKYIDFPFTADDIAAIKAMLYFVNSTNQCINPPHPSWYAGVNVWQTREKDTRPAREVLANAPESICE